LRSNCQVVSVHVPIGSTPSLERAPGRIRSYCSTKRPPDSSFLTQIEEERNWLRFSASISCAILRIRGENSFSAFHVLPVSDAQILSNVLFRPLALRGTARHASTGNIMPSASSIQGFLAQVFRASKDSEKLRSLSRSVSHRWMASFIASGIGGSGYGCVDNFRAAPRRGVLRIECPERSPSTSSFLFYLARHHSKYDGPVREDSTGIAHLFCNCSRTEYFLDQLLDQFSSISALLTSTPEISPLPRRWISPIVRF